MGKATKAGHNVAIARKSAIVENLIKELKRASITIITDYRGKESGLSVKDMRELRKKLREHNAIFRVVKNTLARQALKQTELTELSRFFVEPTAIALGFDDPAGMVKALLDFAKEHKTPTQDEGLPLIKSAYLSGAILDAKKVRAIASLPPKNVLLAQVVGSIQAPIRNFVNVLNAPILNLVNVIEGIRKSKESSN